MSYVLVTKEKHGDFYYDASTDEALAKSALAILTDRWNDGFWYIDPDELDQETQEWRPEALVQNHLGEAWPGWNATENERVAEINRYANDLKTKYGDDQEVYELKSKKFNAAIQEYKRRREYRKWYSEAKALVESQDAAAIVTFKSGRTESKAWRLLGERNDHEYEGVELEPLQEVS